MTARNRRNQPPTGEGKHQSPFRGEPRTLAKRSDVVQAQRGHPELNVGDSDEEAAWGVKGINQAHAKPATPRRLFNLALTRRS
jgi:hypothetical protein